ncbi:MAG: hypothetical protein GY797_26395 [Deltaproteobacteria bacterium]|nr:hypothetical protein [Deltaproteobacteria bacterium]
MIKNILVLILFSLFISLSCSSKTELPTGSDSKQFDSAIWKDESSTKLDKNLISEREKMLKDLVENVLPGKTKIEIQNLLGNSLETAYFSSINKDLIYYMGPERDNYITIDSEWLLIWLDESDKFKKYKLMND